jgi:hypothetical protein
MRALLMTRLTLVVPVLVAVTVLTACAGHDQASTTGAQSTTETTPVIEASTPTEARSTTEAPAITNVTTSTDATLSVDSCDEAAVRDAIVHSDAVAPGLSFEFTYLKCAEGYGWAEISADFGDGATVLFEGSGTDVRLLNLGTAVCATESGIPADVAAQLAPDQRHPLGDCP